MTKHFKIKDIPLDDIIIGKEKLHYQFSDEDINELASSICKNDILQLIFVCPAGESGKYVLLTGEHYFLVYKKLNKKTIKVVVTHKLNETEIRQINIRESRIRQKLSIEDYAHACSTLYRKYGYGSIEALAKVIGLNIAEVSTPTVDFECLEPEIKKLVKDGDIDLEVAILAHIAFHKEY